MHERVLRHHVVDDEHFVLAPDKVRYNESLGEYSFDYRLNGRDRYPYPFRERCTLWLDQTPMMKCDAWWMLE